MTFVIAAAGTGGHVFPGLSVGEALVDRGVSRDRVLFVGGDRLEARVYPEEGFDFLQVEIRGLQRSLTLRNLGIPRLVFRARDAVEAAMSERDTKVALGLGGYVTIPVGMAARRRRIPFFNSEQNARAGLANRVASRWASTTYGSFPATEGLPDAVWVGNPVRRAFWDYNREALRLAALDHYRLDDTIPVLGVFGGSLGAGAINRAVAEMVSAWSGPELQVVHLTGERFLEELSDSRPGSGVTWHRRGFEDRMDLFYAVGDLVVARAGGAVAELTATATPALLIPGDFGSGGHQEGNARFLTDSGAARTVAESELGDLADVVKQILFDPAVLAAMREAAVGIARPRAAQTIADALIEAAR